MKPIHYAIAVIMLVIGILIGHQLPKFTGNEAEAASSNQSDSLQDEARMNAQSNHTGKTIAPSNRTKLAERDMKHQGKSGRVAIPLEKVAKILESRPTYQDHFFNNQQALDEALTMLGANDDEKARVLQVMDQTREDILSAEKRLLRPEYAADGSMSIDFSPMAESVQHILNRTQEGIRGALPADLSETLVKSIKWDRFYGDMATDSTNNNGKVDFKLSRNQMGMIEYSVVFGNRGSIAGSSSPVNETHRHSASLPADDYFPERWKPLFKGIKMAVIEEIEDTKP